MLCSLFSFPFLQMEWHLSNKCPMIEVICPYAKAGCPFQDKRAHLNDHIEASVGEHLELTWSSLAATKQELDNMKDLQQTVHQMQEANQKLTESVADSREEVQNLTLAMKNLEMRNIQQRKWMEDMVRKMAKEMKSLENKMVEVKVTHNDEETRIRGAYLSFPASENRQRRSIVREIANRRACVQMSYPSKRDIDAEPQMQNRKCEDIDERNSQRN